MSRATTGGVRPRQVRDGARRPVLGAWLARLFAAALGDTLWWGALLVGATVLTAAKFAQAGPLVPLAVATWVSYAAHEVAHAWSAVARGVARGDVRLVRHGAGLAVLTPSTDDRDARAIAVAGPLGGALVGGVTVVAVGSAMGLTGSSLLLPVGVVVTNHAVNLLPWAPDGRHAFRRA